MLALVACGGGDSGGDAAGAGGASSTTGGSGGAGGSSADGAGPSTSSASATATTGSMASAASSGAASSGGGNTVCDQWKAARADLSEGTWSGSLAGCNAGDVSKKGRDNALSLVNLYRAMVGLPAVGLDAGYNDAAQACSLMMHANNQLSHFPPKNWKCYSDLGAGAAGKSNIATTPGVQAVDLYMIDPGNETTIGHRRWILSNSLGPIGLGSTSGFSCMWVIGGGGDAQKEFVAWPPPGQVPIEAWNVAFVSLDSTGWTVQSDSITMSGAKVTVSDGGVDKPVETVELLPNYGSAAAVRFNPKGWKTQAGHTYDVKVTGASKPIGYQVEVVDCP